MVGGGHAGELVHLFLIGICQEFGSQSPYCFYGYTIFIRALLHLPCINCRLLQRIVEFHSWKSDISSPILYFENEKTELQRSKVEQLIIQGHKDISRSTIESSNFSNLEFLIQNFPQTYQGVKPFQIDLIRNVLGLTQVG